MRIIKVPRIFLQDVGVWRGRLTAWEEVGDVKKVARIFGVSRVTLYRWRKAGEWVAKGA